MFRHKGKGRTYLHNLKLASILSAVAGIVNIAGVLQLKVLTTNVTGHFAFFSEELVLGNYEIASIYLLYILFFLLGAFTSGIMIEWVAKFKPHASYILPISIEILALLLVGFWPWQVSHLSAFLLLFSMGLQNALVTRVSLSVVRTTHLTGLFTDLGIELSQLFFYKESGEKQKLRRGIFLKLAIIICFFSGGIFGGFVYLHLGMKVLLVPAALLLFALWYDRLLYNYYSLRRKLSHH